jgi:hypothetical protein
MRAVLSAVVFLGAASAAQAAPDLCSAVAKAIEPSLRAVKLAAKPGEPFKGLSIRNAVAKKPAAGLNYGAALDDKTQRTFPLNANDRFLFKDSVRHIARAGGAKGLALLDAESGSAHCHTPLIFDLSSGAPKPVAAPQVSDPYELCGFGGVALGALGGKAFYVQYTDDFVGADRLKLFPLEGETFGAPCALEAQYSIDYKPAEQFCAEPGLCGEYAAKATNWARAFRSGGLFDAALAPIAPIALPEDDPAALPNFGAGPSKLVPEPFHYDGAEKFFTLRGDPRADVLRIGAAYQGPANMANWTSYTLATLYKLGQPVASFVVERRRGAFQSIQTRN